MSEQRPMIIGNIPKLPAKYAMFILPFFISFFMSGIISMINLWRNLGWVDKFPTGLAVRMDDVLGGSLSCSAHCTADCAPFDRCIC